ncbi:MAG: D-alanyl-D-alanine carboxypeptidase [Defluviitaleaceae bacterium]|nr:D-alanyl-D-alanine carboxypeptidase [Defluviitaleaceae bacterium]
MKKLCTVFLVLFIFITPTFADDYFSYGYDKTGIRVSDVQYNAGSVLVLCIETGAVLYENDGFSRRYPASITKIMTALLTIELVDDLNRRFVLSENAVTLPHYAGRLGMHENESMTAMEALYAIMLPSANDVARALAEFIGGDIPGFVELMNRRAAELGAYNTRFVNPCGLPGDGQFTTAYDIALIMREAIKHPIFVDIIATPYFTLPPTEIHEYPRLMRNSNLMVRPTQAEYNPRIIGGKTGFTNAAQHTLVTYASYDGLDVIVSVLFTAPRGAIFSDTAALVEYIFRQLPAEEDEEILPQEEAEVVSVFAPTFYEYAPQPLLPSKDTCPTPQDTPLTKAAATATLSLLIAGAALFIVSKFGN